MTRVRLPRLLLPLLLLACVAGSGHASAQAAFTVDELAGYGLTEEVFTRFAEATARLGQVVRNDARFDNAPLFTRELLMIEDAPTAAAQLDLRLRVEPALARALALSGLSPREYTRFALGLLAAHLADRFLATGALRGVPAGVTTDNVAFVRLHTGTVATVLAEMGIRP